MTAGSAPVAGLAWSPDGRLLATAGDAVRVYLVRADDLLALAHQRASRALTEAERREYLHDGVTTAGSPGAGSPGAGSPVARAAAPCLPLATPVRAGKDTSAGEETQATVDMLLSYWGATTDSLCWVYAIFTDPVEFQLGPFYSTDPNIVVADIGYWGGQRGFPRLVGCDTPMGRTVRCQLELETACDQALGLGPWRLDTMFSVTQGRVEKMIATAAPGQQQRWAAAMEDALTWARQQSPADAAPYRRLLTGEQRSAWEGGSLTATLCELYAQAHPPSPPPAATATPVR